MDVTQVTSLRNTTSRLRERAQRLQQQSYWIMQQCSQVPGQPIPADAAFELMALEEERNSIRSLTAKLERRLREIGKGN